jgi:hypothetical protein
MGKEAESPVFDRNQAICGEDGLSANTLLGPEIVVRILLASYRSVGLKSPRELLMEYG